MILGLADLNRHIGKRIDGFEGAHGGYGIGERNVEGRRLLDFCNEREFGVANTWFKRSKEKQHTVWVKIGLILYWLVKATKSI